MNEMMQHFCRIDEGLLDLAESFEDSELEDDIRGIVDSIEEHLNALKAFVKSATA